MLKKSNNHCELRIVNCELNKKEDFSWEKSKI
jgi:hypothetical protein